MGRGGGVHLDVREQLEGGLARQARRRLAGVVERLMEQRVARLEHAVALHLRSHPVARRRWSHVSGFFSQRQMSSGPCLLVERGRELERRCGGGVFTWASCGRRAG